MTATQRLSDDQLQFRNSMASLNVMSGVNLSALSSRKLFKAISELPTKQQHERRGHIVTKSNFGRVLMRVYLPSLSCL